MKKILVSAILGLAAIASVQAQSAIQLYTYGTAQETAPGIVYGATANGTSGAGVTTGGYTVGYYYSVGDVTVAANAFTGGGTTVSGANNGTLVGSGLTLASGVGATTALGADGPGQYNSASASVIPGLNSTATITVVLVAYSGASYEASGTGGTYRGHSAAFTMPANASPAFALFTGNFAPLFAVNAVPEPSTFALAGLGLASLLIFRRRK